MDTRKLKVNEKYRELYFDTSGGGKQIITDRFNDPRYCEELARRWNAYPDLVEALESLFKHCAMIHKHWGEGSNAKEAQAAEQKARALLQTLKA
jgi:hypothetical protein